VTTWPQNNRSRHSTSSCGDGFWENSAASRCAVAAESGGASPAQANGVLPDFVELALPSSLLGVDVQSSPGSAICS
jgi:hypothetical protein